MAKRELLGWHSGNRQWCKRIGRKLIAISSSQSHYTRPYFYFGPRCETEAEKTAAKPQAEIECLQKLAEWKAIEQLWKNGAPPQGVWSALPVWLDSEFVQKVYETDFKNIAIKEAADIYRQHLRERVGLGGGHGLKLNSYRGYCSTLHIALTYFDQSRPLKSLTKTDIEGFIRYWLNLRDRKLSERQAVNLIKSFKTFLGWVSNDERFEYYPPKGIGPLFKTRIRTKQPLPFDIDQVKAFYLKASPRTKLYMLLALQCGFTQVDIAMLSYMNEDGGIETDLENGIIDVAREKTSHQNNFRTIYKLWPETLVLLKKFAMPEDNALGRVLLGRNGQQLLQVDEMGDIVKRTDSIHLRWKEATERTGIGFNIERLAELPAHPNKRINAVHQWINKQPKLFPKSDLHKAFPKMSAIRVRNILRDLRRRKPPINSTPAEREEFNKQQERRAVYIAIHKTRSVSFRHLRKTMATELAKIAGNEISKQALGQSLPGVEKVYIQQAFDKMNEVLGQFRQKLISAGIFGTLQNK